MALAQARRPLMWLGGGARHAGPAVRRLVELGFGVVTSVISLYYYLQIMKQAFVSKPDEGDEGLLPVPWLMNGMAAALMLGVFYVGLYPQQLFNAIDNATSFLFV